MATFGIESNGRLENTAVYYNGEQLAGLRQVLLNLAEDGTFDAVISYRGEDGRLYTKNPFTDYLKISVPCHHRSPKKKHVRCSCW